MKEALIFQPGYYERENKKCVDCGVEFVICTPKGATALLYQEDKNVPPRLLSLEQIKKLEEKKNQYCPECWDKIKKKQEKREKKRN
jgi:hypothetical protein